MLVHQRVKTPDRTQIRQSMTVRQLATSKVRPQLHKASAQDIAKVQGLTFDAGSVWSSENLFRYKYDMYMYVCTLYMYTVYIYIYIHTYIRHIAHITYDISHISHIIVIYSFLYVKLAIVLTTMARGKVDSHLPDCFQGNITIFTKASPQARLKLLLRTK